MADHVLDRGRLAEAVGNDIADMAQFWMLRKFQFLESARTQFEVIVDPWLSYCEEPSQSEIMAYNMAFADWLLFERPYYHGKTLLELYVDEPPASLSPASLRRLEQVRDTHYFSRFGILDKDPATGMVALRDTRTDRRFDVYDPHIVQKEHWRGAPRLRRRCLADGGAALPLRHCTSERYGGRRAWRRSSGRSGRWFRHLVYQLLSEAGPRHHGRPGALRKVPQHLRTGMGVGDGQSQCRRLSICLGL